MNPLIISLSNDRLVALGGRTFLAPTGHELGFPDIEILPEGDSDPIMKEVLRSSNNSSITKFTLCHGDTFDLPPKATLLAKSERFPQSFRQGSAFAVQFHPEATPRIFENWLQGVLSRYAEKGKPAPLTEQEVQETIQDSHKRAAELRDSSFAMFSAWLHEVRSYSKQTM